MHLILETKRLRLREFGLSDAAFIIELVNTEQWIKNIGDKNIKTEQQAIDYLQNGPIKSYYENGFGLAKVELKEGNIPIGMCGIIRRPTLPDPDIGFAFLPEFMNKGFGYEIASETLDHALTKSHLQKVAAITIPENTASIRLLEKIGMHYQGQFVLENGGEKLLLYST